MHVLPGSQVLSTWPIGLPLSAGSFAIFDQDGDLLLAFGGDDTIDGDSADHARGRPSGYFPGDSTFWAAPEIGRNGDYVLEEWTLTGRFRRSIRRNVSWFRAPVSNPLKLPNITQLRVDRTGLLWVYILVPDRSGEFLPSSVDEIESGGNWERVGDVRIEVIDPNAGVVLASAWLDAFPNPSGQAEPPITTLLAGGEFAARRTFDETGFVSVDLYGLRLVRTPQ
jgi:hypothetical protein